MFFRGNIRIESRFFPFLLAVLPFRCSDTGSCSFSLCFGIEETVAGRWSSSGLESVPGECSTGSDCFNLFWWVQCVLAIDLFIHEAASHGFNTSSSSLEMIKHSNFLRRVEYAVATRWKSLVAPPFCPDGASDTSRDMLASAVSL